MTDKISKEIPQVDHTWPNAARMYDYHLGGSANFQVDRDAVERGRAILPDATYYMQQNRAVLVRAVRYLVQEAGIDQFLDLGSGIPTKGNVHEIAHLHNPDARVAYVDFEPIAVAHARRLLGDTEERVTVTQENIREPEAVLNAPGVAGLLDFSRPMAVLAVGMLPFITDDEEAVNLMTRYRQATVPGSYGAISHISPLTWTWEQITKALRILAETATPEVARTREQILALLPGYTLIEPGLVPAAQWRPDQEPSGHDALRSNCYAAVGYHD
jgi:hypothetical protein